MTDPNQGFDLEEFLPYLLNQAAEATSRGFQDHYRDRYGFTRTHWRVLANLGKFGAMTARDICAISQIDKTKVSRSVAALAQMGMLERAPGEVDKRTEVLSLTPYGNKVFGELGAMAVTFDRNLRDLLGQGQDETLTLILQKLMVLAPKAQTKGS